MEYPFTNQLLYIKRSVINVLLRNANCEPFKLPVNPELLGVPQYPKLIKSPMDFGTIKMKLDKHAYQTANECRSDFMDIFRNCYIFNEPGSLYVEMALKLENLFKRKMAELPMPEIYVPESALQTPKLNKVKKSKLPLSINTPIMTKHKPIGLSSFNSVSKFDTSHAKKRSRNNSETGLKDEPVSKKTKSALDMKICKNMIQNLMSKNYHDWNRYFLDPVDVEGLKLHDYYTVIKKPMDLGTVKAKLLEGRYQTNVEFSEDIKLIFKNCYLYNPEGHEVRRCGKLLEGIFIKLYQSSFMHNKPLHVTKSSRVQTNYNEFQPLLQKILKRQTEIDVLNNDIVKRNQEIQNSLEYIKNTEFIKSFNVNLNGSKHIPKKPFIKPHESVKHEPLKAPISAVTDRNKSPKVAIVPKSVVRDIKYDISSTTEPTENTHKIPKSECVSDNNKPSIKHSLNDTDNVNPKTNSAELHNHSSNKVLPPKDSVKLTKIGEEFNIRLKEIKEWIGSQSDFQRDHIRDFINKSEGHNVVQVNLIKLKPNTINGLYTMMKDMKNNVTTTTGNATRDLRDFSNEERMQLSHDLSIFGDKYSDKILSIYKKTESVESHDGECEIDFQKMKLVTLHRLREFGDKILQKRRDKVKKDGNSLHTAEENGDDSDSDSSDSSDSDSNSDASSNSSSDADFFNNLPQTLGAPETTKDTIISVEESPLSSVPASQAQPAPNDYTSPVATSSQPLSHKPIASNSPIQSRLSDSSDSDLDDDDDGIGSSSKRLRHTTLWNKNPSTASLDVRSPAFVAQSKPKPVIPVPHPMYNHSTRSQLDESLRQIVQDAQAHENVKKQEEELRLNRMREEEEQKKQHLLKIQAMNESRKKIHSTEQLKKDQEIIRLKERALIDQKKRNMDIPEAIEREDYHQLLCDFEYNINHNVIMKLANSERHQVHL